MRSSRTANTVFIFYIILYFIYFIIKDNFYIFNKHFLLQGSKIKSKETKKPATPNTREVEMQNWKRRKSYDPMKAAMEGRRKAGLAKKNTNANLSPR